MQSIAAIVTCLKQFLLQVLLNPQDNATGGRRRPSEMHHTRDDDFVPVHFSAVHRPSQPHEVRNGGKHLPFQTARILEGQPRAIYCTDPFRIAIPLGLRALKNIFVVPPTDFVKYFILFRRINRNNQPTESHCPAPSQYKNLLILQTDKVTRKKLP